MSPYFIGSYETLERVGYVAYKLALPPNLSRVYNVFHVPQLWKYMTNESHILGDSPIELRNSFSNLVKLLEIIGCEEKVLKK